MDADKDLFFCAIKLARVLRPTYVVVEMTRENEHTDSDYYDLQEMFADIGYVPHVYPSLGSWECGDATSRYRYIAVFIDASCHGANDFDLRRYESKNPGKMEDFLDKPRMVQSRL